MARRRKPVGFEKWTWNEINAGRKMSKAEKRWNRIGNDLNWDKRPDGSYQAPTHAIPILVVMAILMFGLMIVAPNGIAYAKGDAGAVGTLLFLGVIGAGLILVLVGHNFPTSNSLSSATASPPTPKAITPPTPPVIIPALKRCGAIIAYGFSCKWVTKLPEWAQPIIWGLGMAVPVVAVIVLAMRIRR
jgi:hypothetical protein